MPSADILTTCLVFWMKSMMLIRKRYQGQKSEGEGEREERRERGRDREKEREKRSEEEGRRERGRGERDKERLNGARVSDYVPRIVFILSPVSCFSFTKLWLRI